MARNSITFPANTDYGTITNTAILDAPTTMSISMWIKTTTALTFHEAFSKGDISSAAITFDLDILGLINPNGIIAIIRVPGNYYVDGDFNIKNGAWHNLIWTFDSTDKSNLYFDGVLDSTATYSGVCSQPPSSAQAIHIGYGYHSVPSTSGFQGAYASIRAWSTVLTAGNATTIAAGGDVATGKVLDWELTEGTGLTAADTSGGGNTLTFTNVTWSSDIPTQLVTASGAGARMLKGVGA